jgi:hypothetical protein
MARAPKPPSLAVPLVDKDGRLTPEWYKYLTGGVSFTTNVNSGVTQAQAAAAQAQATATGAIAGIATLASQTAPGGFYASATPSSAFGDRVGTGTATTNAVTVVPTGGTGPYTYAWVLDLANFTIGASTSATTSFTGFVSIGTTTEDIATCTVTDSLAATASISIGVAIYAEGVAP